MKALDQTFRDSDVNDASDPTSRACSDPKNPHFVDKAAAGFLMDKELRYLGEALENPKRPLSSSSAEQKYLTRFPLSTICSSAHVILIGGAMAYTFQRSQYRNRMLTGRDRIRVELAIGLERRHAIRTYGCFCRLITSLLPLLTIHRSPQRAGQ